MSDKQRAREAEAGDSRRSKRLGGELRLMPPKSERSRRTVPLPQVCAVALDEHQRRQAIEPDAAGSRWQDHGLVFTTTRGTLIDPRNLNRFFGELCGRARLRPVRLHDPTNRTLATCARLSRPTRLTIRYAASGNK